MLRTITIMFTLLSALLFSSNALACDDKSCESAYLVSTERYIANHIRRANAQRAERVAYSKVREKRDYALYVHIIYMQDKLII